MDELAKSQAVRVLDVILIGPVMAWAATRLPKEDAPMAWLLGGLGIATVVYNARNYLRIQERSERSESPATPQS